ncbi:uncharacterized protein CLUP02_02069 [Colletotrichum lupini]|uniref:Uncharacterized protein n=1 Tax=Colletotrichum lupini TaxID=145971 RepID=A0A9Q8SEB1_9PEZI|nr:uncharacterized protein CLUP02_02069 [Colletotrichum lupini]UQC75415.1 hypothetical protein CLUP02_02069 [Colletotrichum lupini]
MSFETPTRLHPRAPSTTLSSAKPNCSMHDDREIFESALQFDSEKQDFLRQDIAVSNCSISYPGLCYRFSVEIQLKSASYNATPRAERSKSGLDGRLCKFSHLNFLERFKTPLRCPALGIYDEPLGVGDMPHGAAALGCMQTQPSSGIKYDYRNKLGSWGVDIIDRSPKSSPTCSSKTEMTLTSPFWGIMLHSELPFVPPVDAARFNLMPRELNRIDHVDVGSEAFNLVNIFIFTVNIALSRVPASLHRETSTKPSRSPHEALAICTADRRHLATDSLVARNSKEHESSSMAQSSCLSFAHAEGIRNLWDDIDYAAERFLMEQRHPGHTNATVTTLESLLYQVIDVQNRDIASTLSKWGSAEVWLQAHGYILKLLQRPKHDAIEASTLPLNSCCSDCCAAVLNHLNSNWPESCRQSAQTSGASKIPEGASKSSRSLSYRRMRFKAGRRDRRRQPRITIAKEPLESRPKTSGCLGKLDWRAHLYSVRSARVCLGHLLWALYHPWLQSFPLPRVVNDDRRSVYFDDEKPPMKINDSAYGDIAIRTTNQNHAESAKLHLETKE